MRARLLLAVIVLAAGVTPATAAPKPPALGGTVRVSVSRTMAMDVRLTRPVSFDRFTAPKGSRISGDGRIVGLLLLDAKHGVESVLFLRYGHCATEGCRPTTPTTKFHAIGRTSSGAVEHVPAGDYRLVVVTDGRPVSVTLTLPGLKGTTTLRPTRAIPVQHRSFDFSVFTASPVQTAYSAATDVNVDGGSGVLLHQFSTWTDMSVQQQGTFCTFTGEVGEPAPHCPGGRGTNFSFVRVDTDEDRWGLTGHTRYLDEGRYRAGPYFSTVGSARDPVGSVAWFVLPPA